MKRQGFILGLFSVGGQVLLLRELVSSLNGDELFIGTALFGWLLSVAVGAFVGGRRHRRTGPRPLLIIGAVLLPVMVVAVRLSTLAVTDIVGEVVPFSTAAVMSIVAMCPIGFISGWLFPSITQQVLHPAREAIVIVYLFEGIGAFVGGIAITLCAGSIMSTFSLATAVSAVVIGSVFLGPGPGRVVIVTCLIAAVIGGAVALTPRVDTRLDSLRFRPYQVLASFDTHYGHQAILTRDNSLVLMTDNAVEAVSPDLETAENHLLAPLLYHPEAQTVLYVGRSEFGAARLAGNLPSVTVTALDPRGKVTAVLERIIPAEASVEVIEDDAVSYFSAGNALNRFDIIILNPGEPDNYHTGRFFTSSFLRRVKDRLEPDGLLCIPTGYDTERYIGPDKTRVLSILYRTLQGVFARVAVWPGTMTIFLASDTRGMNPFADSIAARVGNLPCEAAFINESYLMVRLDNMKVDRLLSALSEYNTVNTREKPVLTHFQALYRSTTSDTDRRVTSLILERPLWIGLVPVLILLFLAAVITGNRHRRGFGLFLYFTAGMVSLSLELISFYLYQTTAGSLYSEMALLIGAFMLGLAVGTYYSHRVGNCPLEYPALLILLVSILVFLTVYTKIDIRALLIFHALFLFVVAIATGTLFVGATNRYYSDTVSANRGLGYGWELLGSSLGALLTMTILLPLIGLTWLLLSLAGLVATALLGAFFTGRQTFISLT